MSNNCEVIRSLPIDKKLEYFNYLLSQPVPPEQYKVWFGNVFDVFMCDVFREFPSLIEAISYVEYGMVVEFTKRDYKDFTDHPRLAIWVSDPYKKEVHLYMKKEWSVYSYDDFRELRNSKNKPNRERKYKRIIYEMSTNEWVMWLRCQHDRKISEKRKLAMYETLLFEGVS